MSYKPLFSSLIETYDNCAGNRFVLNSEGLTPLWCVGAQSHIEMQLNEKGHCCAAKFDPQTIKIPCTSASIGSRTVAPAPHGLVDQLEYLVPEVAQAKRQKKDKTTGATCHELFMAQLQDFLNQYPNPYVSIYYQYLEHGTMLADIARYGGFGNVGEAIPTKKEDFENEVALKICWDKDDQEIYLSKLMVRVQVRQGPGPKTNMWDGKILQDWQQYQMAKSSDRKIICCLTGNEDAALPLSPKLKLNNTKIISSNDTTNYTFRGFVQDPKAIAEFGATSIFKSHAALDWLGRSKDKEGQQQGISIGTTSMIFWSTQGMTTNPLKVMPYMGFAGQDVAPKIISTIRGYHKDFDQNSSIHMVIMDKTSPGRSAILGYQTFDTTQYFDQLQDWYLRNSWFFIGKDKKPWIKSPTPYEIFETAYPIGNKSKGENRFKYNQITNITRAIVGLDRLNPALLTRCFATTQRQQDKQLRARYSAVTSALYRYLNLKENYTMTLERSRTSRDYLFGRLLALAQYLEQRAQYCRGNTKEPTTHAERLWSRYIDRPSTTYLLIQQRLAPYAQHLKQRRGGEYKRIQDTVAEVMGLFQGKDFSDNTKLSSEFLLSYYLQRQNPLCKNESISEDIDSQTTNPMTEEVPS